MVNFELPKMKSTTIFYLHCTSMTTAQARPWLQPYSIEFFLVIYLLCSFVFGFPKVSFNVQTKSNLITSVEGTDSLSSRIVTRYYGGSLNGHILCDGLCCRRRLRLFAAILRTLFGRETCRSVLCMSCISSTKPVLCYFDIHIVR